MLYPFDSDAYLKGMKHEIFGRLFSSNSLPPGPIGHFLKPFGKRKKNYREVIITINQTVDYMARGIMIFMRGVDIMRGIGRGFVESRACFGP